MWPTSPEQETAIVGVVLGAAACAVALIAADGSAWPMIVLAALPLVARARWASMPMWSLLLATTVPIAIAESMEDRPTSATWLIGCVALIVATMDRRRRFEWIAIALVVGGPLWLEVGGATDRDDTIVAIWSMGLLLSATGGTIVGQQRQLVVTMREAQANLAAAAAADERQRIAREVHDLVGHSFSVVLLHLAGARHLMRTDHARAESALRLAEDVGRQSMNDLRASLALLRSDGRSLAPVGDLVSLPGLVDNLRRAGLDVTFAAHGDLDDVDAAVGVVVHGVAREALTNAAKHAADGPVTCTITVDDRVELRVTNRTAPDRDVADQPAGQGLAGMRERVQAVGGSLSVTEADGDWIVVVQVPARSRQAVR